DNDKIIDGTDVSEDENINMYFYKGGVWQLCMSSNKNIEENTVESIILNSGIYGLFVSSRQQTDIIDIKQIQTFITPEVPLVLPFEVVECNIYDLRGNKVLNLKRGQDIVERIIWYGKVENNYVESGVYILDLKFSDNKKKRKMVIFAK
ncbi:MAG: hypothetical protein N2Z73_05000, partial [Endomicrobia bacterium]|nr:hypothetical protein [Endomicrobiia bacterium]